MINIEDSKNLWDFTTPFVPTFAPYNDAAKRLTNHYHDVLELPRTPSNGPKYNGVVASALAAFQSVMSYETGYLYWPIKQDRFSAYQLAGRVILQNTQEAMVKHGLITLIHKGQPIFTKHKRDKVSKDEKDVSFQFKKLPTLWEVSEDLLERDDFWEAEFQDIGRPAVVVGEFQTWGDRYYAKIDGRASAKIPTTKIDAYFGYDSWVAKAGVTRLADYWKDYPLTLHLYKGSSSFTRHASSASRVFSNGSITKGGRFYGMWSNMDKGQRLRATINGKPTVQIDIKASQPTLLSAFLGKRMKVGDTWSDVYGLIVEDIHEDGALKNSSKSDLKVKVKSVIMELIGTGNHTKWQPAKNNELEFGEELVMVIDWDNKRKSVTETFRNEYSLIAAYCKKRIPALWDLKKGTYDSEFLSYHESEIIAWTMHRLLETKVNGSRVVAYPMHDCLIVAKDAEEVAALELRRCIAHYTLKTFNTTFMFDAALSIEEAGQNERVLQGQYYNELISRVIREKLEGG